MTGRKNFSNKGSRPQQPTYVAKESSPQIPKEDLVVEALQFKDMMDSSKKSLRSGLEPYC